MRCSWSSNADRLFIYLLLRAVSQLTRLSVFWRHLLLRLLGLSLLLNLREFTLPVRQMHSAVFRDLRDGDTDLFVGYNHQLSLSSLENPKSKEILKFSQLLGGINRADQCYWTHLPLTLDSNEVARPQYIQPSSMAVLWRFEGEKDSEVAAFFETPEFRDGWCVSCCTSALRLIQTGIGHELLEPHHGRENWSHIGFALPDLQAVCDRFRKRIAYKCNIDRKLIEKIESNEILTNADQSMYDMICKNENLCEYLFDKNVSKTRANGTHRPKFRARNDKVSGLLPWRVTRVHFGSMSSGLKSRRHLGGGREISSGLTALCRKRCPSTLMCRHLRRAR